MAKLLIAVVATGTSWSEEVSISAFDASGELVFGETEDALAYHIEWAPQAIGPWTNFTGDLGQWMDSIPATGEGYITSPVPRFFRVIATVPPTGMVYVPAGSFKMGNATNIFSASEGSTNELPQHDVSLDSFYIDKYEVTRALWIAIAVPAVTTHGYSFSNSVATSPTDLPVKRILWYDAVKWSNARSEIEGLIPVYYTDPGFSNVYQAGQVEPYPNWSANGYRLPTEAEWERAARGGGAGLRFPWSDYSNKISHARANYVGSPSSYDLSSGFHPVYGGLRSPVGSFEPNDWGIYDMAGNLREWCWDWYDASYYAISPSTNPTGPVSGTFRVYRGGESDSISEYVRCSARGGLFPDGLPSDSYDDFGFRCVRKP